MKKIITLIIVLIISVGCSYGRGVENTQSSKTSSVEATEADINEDISEEEMTETEITETDVSETQQIPSLPYAPTESDLRDRDEMSIEPVYSGTPDKFPASAELPHGVKSVIFKDGFSDDGGLKPVKVISDVLYDERDNEKLTMQIIMPEDIPSDTLLPLIIYIPGSAWMRQNVSIAVPQMKRVAAHGYVVAVTEYRGTDVAYFPAQTEDAKTAVRFMRMNAEEYMIDSENIIIWGDSSGGHTAVMAGITGDRELNNDAYGEYSAEVNCIIDWYGPVDITLMSYYPSMLDHASPASPEGRLIGGLNVLENTEAAQKTNPLNYLSEDIETPPVLIMHGSADTLVPFNQSVRLYEKLRELGKTVEMYKLEGAGHGFNGFAGDSALDVVLEFIKNNTAAD